MKTLEEALRDINGCSGTLHRRDGDVLKLMESHGVPEHVVTLIERIPKGKGMAGQAWLRCKAITTCDLASDPDDVIQPGARAVEAKAAIALPVMSGGVMHSVVGFAFADGRLFETDFLQTLEALALEVAVY
jgi:L-methionine (R)-S-oxide reductase